MRFMIILSVFMAFFGFTRSQSVQLGIKQTMDLYNLNKLHEKGINSTLSAEDIEGSPYLNDEFISGTVYMIQNQKYERIDLRYNIFNDQVEFNLPGEEVQILAAPEMLEKVEIGPTEMVYLPYSIGKKIKKGFLIVLLEGKASLYAKPEIFFKKAIEPAAYKDAQPPAFERRADQYFIRVGNSEAKLTGNKKELLDAFPDHENEIENFIKKNKTKTNDSLSLKQLVEFYNSL